MARGLAGLRAVAETAPLLGMLGTVWSVIVGSRCCCVEQYGDVSDGISETFVLLALGLAVGIVASVAYHYLSTRLADLDAELQNAARSLPYGC